MSRSTGSPLTWQMSCLASLTGTMSRHPQPLWIWLEGYQRSPGVTLNRTRLRSRRRERNAGKPMLLPVRVPALDAFQLARARARSAIPAE